MKTNTIIRILAGILIIWLLFVVVKCDREVVVSDHEKEIKASDSVIASKDAEIESIKLQKSELSKQRKADSINELSLNNKIAILTNSVKLKIAKSKSFTASEQADFYNQRYSLPNNAKTTANGIELSRMMVGINIEDLIDCDGTRNELDLMKLLNNNIKSQLSICDSICKLSEKQIKALTDKFTNSELKFKTAESDYQKLKSEQSKEIKFRLLVGGGFGINKELNQLLYKLDASFQNKKGNQFTGSYMKISGQDYFLAGTQFTIFNIKK